MGCLNQTKTPFHPFSWIELDPPDACSGSIFKGIGFILETNLLSLPRPIFNLFLLSAGLFLSGAVGMEMVSGKHAEAFGVHTYTFGVMITVEESLEMIGTMVFIFALLRYLALCVPEVSFVLARPKNEVVT